MRNLRLCKFDSLHGHEPEPVTIIIDGKIPEHHDLQECEKFHDNEAFWLEKALFESLPQGTYDRLAILFASRKVSLYRGRTE